MKLQYDISNNSGEIEFPSESIILEHIEKLKEDDFLILDDAPDQFVQTKLAGDGLYLLEHRANDVLFAANPPMVSKDLIEKAFVEFFLHGPNSSEFQKICAWVQWEEVNPESMISPGKSLSLSAAWEFPTSDHQVDTNNEPSGKKLAQQRISECWKEKGTVLDLCNCDLTILPQRVGKMKWLKSLYLSGNIKLGIKEKGLEPIAELVNLKVLNISNTEVSDLSFVTGLSNLEKLYVSNTKIRRLKPLAKLTNLKTIHLDLSKAKVLDVTALSGLLKLQSLVISNEDASDLTPLASLVNLKSLFIDLSRTRVRDLSGLAGLINLAALDISNTEVRDLTPLSNLENLTFLNISNTEIRYLTPLAGLANLVELDLSGTLVTDLSPLTGLKELRSLTISGKPFEEENATNRWPFAQRIASAIPSVIEPAPFVCDLAPLSHLLNLENVDISGTLVSDLSPLSGLVNLKELNLSGTPVSDLSPLVGLSRLRTLNASRTKVSDLAPLSRLMNLRDFTPSAGVEKFSRRLYLCLDVIEKIAKTKDGQTLAKIAKELLQENIELGLNISRAHRLIQEYDPYPRNSPLWERPDRITGWPSMVRKNAQLILYKVDFARKVLAASACWKSEPESEKLQLHIGKELPLPTYLLERLEPINLTLVRNFINTTNTVLETADLDDLHLLNKYLEFYGLAFKDLFADMRPLALSDPEPCEISFDKKFLLPVRTLELTSRAQKCLEALNIVCIGDLIQWTEDELRKTPNIGTKSINEIKEVLSSQGLRLGVKIESWPPSDLAR